MSEFVPIYHRNGIYLHEEVSIQELEGKLPALTLVQLLKSYKGCVETFGRAGQGTKLILKEIYERAQEVSETAKISPTELYRIGMPSEHSSTYSVPIYEESGRYHLVFIPDDKLGVVLPRLTIFQLLCSFDWCEGYYGILHPRTQYIIHELERRM